MRAGRTVWAAGTAETERRRLAGRAAVGAGTAVEATGVAAAGMAGAT